MNKALLLFSPPGSKDYSVYRDAPDGHFDFQFVSFRGFLRVQLQMEECELPNEPHLFYRPEAELPDVLSSNEYTSLVSDAISEIRNKALGKIVTSRCNVLDHPGDTLELYYAVQNAYPEAAVYLFSHPACGTWLGATPETLLKKEQETLETMSLAGTRRKDAKAGFTAKEEEEQSLVTQYISDIFRKEVGVTQTRVEPAQESEAGHLIHFRSIIRGQTTEDFDARSILHKLHPTPAVGGLPVEPALDFIQKHENYNRTFYAGYLGLKEENDFHYFVNLRCMQVFEKKVALYAGGGVTKGSNPMAEFEETQSKMETLQKILDRVTHRNQIKPA